MALNFDGDGDGGDIVVLSGTAAVGPRPARREGDPAYLAKYDEHIARIDMTPETFAREYSVPVHIRLTGLQGY